MNYTPHVSNDIKSMLKDIGLDSIEDLYSEIPKELRTKSFNLPGGISEFEAFNNVKSLSEKNNVRFINFMGGGFYDHYIPSVVDSLSSRGEFFTAYTPYQPEASQGTLQALYEYQTSISNLYDMEVSNASLYDGGTALVEAILMAIRITKKKRILVDKCVNPIYRKMINSYFNFLDYEIIEIDNNIYSLDRDKLKNSIDDTIAAVVIENPNFFGTVDDYSDIANLIHEKKGLLILSSYPISTGLLKTPGEMDADIVTGEGQSLGNPLNFGGPYLGLISTKMKYIRNLPGRITGKTVDKNGKDAFVLTLQAREQHIKRQKATSNICSNQGLCALRALIFLTAIGKDGLKDMAKLNYSKAMYAKKKLNDIDGYSTDENQEIFNTFVLTVPEMARELEAKMFGASIASGIPLGKYYENMENKLLVTVTEKRTKSDIDWFVKELEELR